MTFFLLCEVTSLRKLYINRAYKATDEKKVINLFGKSLIRICRLLCSLNKASDEKSVKNLVKSWHYTIKSTMKFLTLLVAAFKEIYVNFFLI